MIGHLQRNKVKYIFFVLCFIFLNKDLHAYENFILYKINNEMITNYDLTKETKYMLSLNPKIQSLSRKKLEEISLQSIINEKSKKIELQKTKIETLEDLIQENNKKSS